jgi:hypothetical protein
MTASIRPLTSPRHCERSDVSAAARRAKAEAIQSIGRDSGLLRRFAPLRKRFAFVAGNDGREAAGATNWRDGQNFSLPETKFGL